MALTKYKLGDLIELVTETNSDLRYGPKDVKGMTITKEVIPTKADVEGADLSKYIVVSPNEFVFNPRTHGKHIGFGFNNTDSSFIISWNNYAFRIKSDKSDVALPDYLFLHFKRDEWDREACYQSWGTSTEVFTWAALCDMSIDLPSIDIQKKYVAIYNSLLANQKSYERGLEDLKKACDSIIDRVKHESERKPVSLIFEEIDVRNNLGITDVNGINITKQFMPSVANTLDVDLSKYKVVHKGQFAFSGMQTGRDECIRIALHDQDHPIIISPAYTVLELKDKSVMAEYIMLWFTRSEVDRLGWFMSDSSVRTNLDMDRFYEIEIPIPDFTTQKSIVDIYLTYKSRFEIVQHLRQQIQGICPILIKGSIEESQK